MKAPAVPHPRLDDLVSRACASAAAAPPALAVVYPCDAAALEAALRIGLAGIARPLLVGPAARIRASACAAGLDLVGLEIDDTGDEPAAAARRGAELAREGQVQALMKGSLHTDELMSVVVGRDSGLRTDRRISHVFLFDLTQYHKLLGLADCVVNIAPDVRTKRDILSNAVDLLQRIGVAAPKVGIVAAVETPHQGIPATLHAQELVQLGAKGQWPGATVEGPFGFDNAFSAEAARTKGIASMVAGDADLLLVPDLNAGNMLYKSFNYVGGGDCAGVVVGTSVPVVLTSRADSLQARVASVALAVLANPA